MAIAFVRSASGSQDVTSSVVVNVPAAGFAAGNKLIIAAFDADSNAFYSQIVDTAGNTYSSRHQYAISGRTMEIWEADLTTGLVSGNTITGTQPTGGGYMHVCEFSGLQTGNSLDKQAQATTFNNIFSSGATTTTSQADELIFGAVWCNSPTVTYGSDAPFVEILDTQWAAGSQSMQTQYRIVAATGAYTSSGTITAVQTSGATVDTFKGAAAPVTQQQVLMPHGIAAGAAG